ncbi:MULTISPECIES: hypothetical protein [Moorena]|uniref:hypothetical protein n=1 Tax=Moorena TaxID=1155738 RepID=UPI0012B61A0C|nr:MULTISPECIES: hypothetical protein [Moorena]NEP36308.1 hypothetical protein [Moorena sp. SIO3B2]NEP66273.1 hypothetical protein [Moorena sp. SIO3A5]NEQ16957.1 hypothetical protein [Moorena sp. SIO3E2]NER88015.1 hypothetical protein [Moorena sp. SIO3A2]
MPVSIPRRTVPTLATSLNIRASPPLTHSSRLPTPDSRLPTPFIYIYSPRIYQ